jgi:hypothetical protein
MLIGHDGVVVGEDVDIFVEIELIKKWSPHGLRPVPARRSPLRHAGVAPPHAS